MNIVYLVSKYPFLWCQAYSAKEVYLKVKYKSSGSGSATLVSPPPSNRIRSKMSPRTLVNFLNISSSCQRPGCDAGIREETIDPVKCGAGLKLRAECYMGHHTSIQTCEFFNQGRTSTIDVRISVLQLVIGISMSHKCLFEFYRNNILGLFFKLENLLTTTQDCVSPVQV
jgi:hypothetical protein